MADINEKRAYVENLYPGTNWKIKVRHMTDIQVTAIYLRKKDEESRLVEQPKDERETDDEIPF